MTKSVFKYSLILFSLSSVLIACNSAFNKKVSLEHKKINSKVTYVYEDGTNDFVVLNSSSLRSNYVIEGNKLYVRLQVNKPSYMSITYIVVKNFEGAMQYISSFTIDTAIHPGTMRYLSKVELANTYRKGSVLIISMKLKSLIIKSTLSHHLKNILMKFNNITLKKVDNLSILKSFDDNWEYAKSIRENEFKVY